MYFISIQFIKYIFYALLTLMKVAFITILL